MHDEVDKRFQASVEVARQDPFPDVKEVTEHVYA
jgi:TPP-dependent pyruvate/acetoin dehydrogenase alpha subunit